MPSHGRTNGAVSLASGSRSGPRPTVWAPVERTVSAAFAGLARLRRARAFHPEGASYEGSIRPTRLPEELPFLAAGERPALVRLSKGAGLPPRIPDVYGLSFRIPDVYGPGAHQDVLLASSGQRPVARHAIAPTIGFDRRHFSTVLVYRYRGQLTLVGARYIGARRTAPLQLGRLDDAMHDGELAFEVSVAGLRGPWRSVGTLSLARRLPAGLSKQLRFHPWNASAEFRPVGPLNHVRAAAYEASQRTATSE